jgi:hypothetical protein
MRHTRRIPAVPLLLAALLTGCGGGGVEGKYYNQAGQFVLELKGGKVNMAPGGLTMMNAAYEVRGDSIIIKDPSNGQEAAALVRQKDGSIDAGMMGTLKKK